MADILSDPRLAKPMAAFREQVREIERLTLLADDWNDPREHRDAVSSEGGGPGRQQCERFVKDMSRLLKCLQPKLDDAVEDMTAAMPAFREVKREPVVSVGGKPVRERPADLDGHKVLRVVRHLNKTYVDVVVEGQACGEIDKRIS